jgi:hypothetical protein
MHRFSILGGMFALALLAGGCDDEKDSTGGGAGAGSAGTTATAGVNGGTAGTTTGTAGTTGAGCTEFMGMGAPESGNSACTTCLQTHCNADLTTCWGASWATGDTSAGACSSFLACTSACSSCSDINCLFGCVGSLSNECQTCSQATATCQQDSCATECGGTTGTAGSGG